MSKHPSKQHRLLTISRGALKNPTDEQLRTVFKMEEDIIEFHCTCGLSKASIAMKTFLN